MSEIVAWSAVETVARLKARDVSAEEVCRAHLQRLETVNPELNAVVDDVPDAIERARAIDAGNVPRGILHGAPITTKINTDQDGLASTNGLPGLAQNIAPGDSAVIANFKAAGAVIVGRTNTPEMSLRWCTSNPLHGTSLNPWDTSATPGGSSGAAAAAVATGIGVIAHGNDVGGSVRYPAYCCGVAGLRPSLGRVPAYNPSAPSRSPIFAAMSVQGPIARSVADVALGLEAMRSYNANDPLWSPAAASARTRRDGPTRLGIAPTAFGGAEHPEVKAALSRATDAAREAGMTIVEVDAPEIPRICEIWGQMLFTEVDLTSSDMIANMGSPELNRWLDAFSDHFGKLDLAGYVQAVTDRITMQRAWANMFEDIDALLLPTSLIPPFENDLDFKAPERAGELIKAQAPLYVVNLLGLPSLALPTHVASGLPIGVQIVGPMHDDDAILEMGLQLERELGRVLDQMPERFRL